MAIDLLSIKPHVVSRDLSSYITFIYGAPKTGKTTLSTQMPKALLLAFEKGYNAIPGVLVQDINTWGEMKQVYRELKKPEVKEFYQCIIVDTVDIAADLCQKYICNQLGIENMGDGGWNTNSWPKYKKEFEDVFRGLTMLGYAVFFISHENRQTEKDKDSGKEILQIAPTVQSSALKIIENMADIYGYAYQNNNPTTGEHNTRLMLRCYDNTIRCGCRFKYMPADINFSYQSLVDALNHAIDEEAKEHDNQLVTDERVIISEEPTFNFDALQKEFKELVDKLMTANQSNAVKITAIVDRFLGKGKKVSDAGPQQAELISLVVDAIKTELM